MGVGEAIKNNIITRHMPEDWAFITVYDDDPNCHDDAVTDALNSGHHLINHAEHGEWNRIGIGSSHTECSWRNRWYYSDDVDNLHNARLSIMCTISCNSANISYNSDAPCVGEAFIRNPNSGVAYIGNTGPVLTGSDPNDLAAAFDREIFRSLWSPNNPNDNRLGVCLANAKEAAAAIETTDSYSWHHLTLLGDPELPVWTEDPKNLLCSYPARLFAGYATSFIVQIQTQGDSPEGARVCLWKDDEIYRIGCADECGDAVFSDVQPDTIGQLSVTVTLHNYIPHQGYAYVVCLGDLNDDHAVDSSDLAILYAHYGMTSGVTYIDGDLDRDGDVDLNDLAAMLAAIQFGCD